MDNTPKNNSDTTSSSFAKWSGRIVQQLGPIESGAIIAGVALGIGGLGTAALAAVNGSEIGFYAGIIIAGAGDGVLICVKVANLLKSQPNLLV